MRGGLGRGDRPERRDAADGLGSGPQLGEQVRLGRPAPPDVRVVGLDLVERRRRAVGHHEAAGGHVGSSARTSPSACTRSTTCSRMPGSSLGEHAVAEVEDVAGVAGVLGQHRAGPRRPRHPTVRGTARGRGCPGGPCPAPTRRRATDSGVRQSTPTTSAPAEPISAEQLAGVDAEVDAGHAERGRRAARTPCGSGAGRGARTGRASSAPAHESKSWNARAPASTCEPIESAARWARRSSSSPKSTGSSPSIIALVRRVGARRPPLDEVAGDGERRAGEADERHGQLAGEDPHRLEHVGRVDLGLERAEPVEVGPGRERVARPPGRCRGRRRRRSRWRRRAPRCRCRGWRRRRRSGAPAAG